ncbi:Inner membrane protein yabI [Serratia fonticola]|uniref:Inner membrane protein yabI n=1 Tax=Serratia fonticola TaxID=47917 RepID=A0A3S4XCL5_SERFO|nr:Inner membrane protein yabI [Serratia fonticola]
MEAYLQQLITQSLAFTLVVVMLVAFLESLALVGLLLPGTVMMASIGALIGSGQVDFYMAWGAGIVGCLLGIGSPTLSAGLSRGRCTVGRS